MKKLLFFATIALAVLVSSCAKPKVEDAVTLTSAASVTVPTEGDVVSITFTPNVAWTAKSSASWLTVSPASGEAGEKVTIKASALKNDTTDERTADITITAGTASTKVTVTQSQLDAMNVSTTEFTVEAEGGTVEVPVSANVDYQVSIPEAVDWVHVTSTKGMVDSKVVLAVDPTHQYDATCFETGDWDVIIRSANITIKAGDLEQVVKVGQKTFAPYFDYKGDWAGLQWSFYDGAPVIIPQEGADITIDIDTNIEWRTYFSVWDNDLATMVDCWDLGWAKLTFDDSHIYLKVEPNDTYFARENYLYSVGMIDEVEDGNFGGLGWFRQEGMPIEGAVVEMQWQKSLADLGIPAGYNRLAYTATGALLVSDGEKVHAVSPSDGTYWKAITYPGITPTSIDSDDAGNVVVVPNLTAEIDWGTGVLTSGTELTIYYSDDPNEMKNSMVVENKDYGTVGGVRVRGNLAEKAVITGVVGSSSCWFGYDIQNYAAVPNYYGTQNQGPGAGVNTFWSPETAAAVSVGTSLHEGVLYRGYDGNESVYYLKDAYTPNWAVPYEWTLVTNAGNGGNENQNNMDIVDYNGKRILVYTQGFHFDYSANAAIYVFDATDINDVKPLATIEAVDWVLSDNAWSGSNSADVLLHPAGDYLELYVVQSGKSTLAKFTIILG